MTLVIISRNNRDTYRDHLQIIYRSFIDHLQIFIPRIMEIFIQRFISKNCLQNFIEVHLSRFFKILTTLLLFRITSLTSLYYVICSSCEPFDLRFRFFQPQYTEGFEWKFTPQTSNKLYLFSSHTLARPLLILLHLSVA